MSETTPMTPWPRWYRLGGALLALLLSGPAALAQLSGAYTINSALPTGGTNYASFGAAATALNTSGVSGPVTFAVSGGPYTEQLRLPAITGSSATNRITFNGGGRTIQFQTTAATAPAVVTLDGADYVTLNNLNITALTSSIASWGVQLVNNADNNVVSNCTVTTGVAFNCAGIVSGAASSSITAAGATANQNVTISGNTVQGGYYGIVAMGNTTAAPTPGVVISNNTVRDFYQYGLYAGYLDAPQLTGNEATRPTATSVTTFYGIYLTTGVSGAAVERNRLHGSFAAGTGGTSYGIYVGTGTAATATSPNYVINNLVYDISSSGAVYGIYNSSSAYTRYYYNTIDINDPSSTSINSSYGFYQLLGPNVEFLNNIVRVNRGGGLPQYAVFLSTGTTGSTVCNYNDLSGQGANFITGSYVLTNYITFAAWRTANNAAFDQNSTNAEPGFENVATGNLRPTASPLDGKATPLTRVPQDFTGTARAAAPDLGAYEFTPPAFDVAVLSIDAPTSPVVAGARPVVATVLNNGSTTLTSVRLQYVLNGGPPVAQTFTLSGLAAGASQSLTFTTPATLLAGSDTLTVTASLPNGQPDANATNNARTTVLYTALRGTYTINQQQPASATNFASFGAAAAALNGGGVAGPVRLNVLNGPYTGPFVLGVIPGVSATDTVVVDGGANKQTLTYNGTVVQSAAISLLDTDYVTLQNLTIDVAGALGATITYGTGVQLQGAAENNRIAACVILTSLTTTSGGCVGIQTAAGNSSTLVPPGNANNLRVERNVISGGYSGVVLVGNGNSRATGQRVTDNEVRDFYRNGIDLQNSTGARVMANNIHRLNRSVTTAFYGINAFNNLSSIVENNRIHDTFTGAPTGGAGASAYGIYYTANSGTLGTENDVVNNVVYNFTGTGFDYGIYNSGTGYTRYYHNTVSLDNAAYTGTSACYAFYQTGVANFIDFRNNLLSVTRGGTGNKYALYFGTAVSAITSDYNNLYVTGANGYTGYYNSNQVTLVNWRAVNSAAYDQNSVALAPQFANVATGDLLPLNAALDGTGTGALRTRVPRDIVGTLRPALPDPGAYELTVVPNDVAVLSINAPATPAVLGPNPVTVTIRNDGTAPLTSVTLSYAVNNGATPATNSQAFTGLNLAYRATQQLTFTAPIALTQAGTYTLTVTGNLPNGQPDGNAANNTQTITFDQLTPAYDEPCGAIALTGQLAASNVNCTTSTIGGIVNTLPTCSNAQLPKDVWFTWTPAVSNPTLYFSGNAAGLVRVFTAATCSTGFVQVACRASAGANTSLGNVALTGLTAGQRYYLAVSGYASNDPTGSFTVGLVPLGTRPQTNAAALTVFPNPTATGAFTLRLSGLDARAGRLQLLNALGQIVRVQPLSTAPEQQVSTRGLAPGLYTLLVQVGAETLTRKVVVE